MKTLMESLRLSAMVAVVLIWIALMFLCLLFNKKHWGEKLMGF